MTQTGVPDRWAIGETFVSTARTSEPSISTGIGRRPPARSSLSRRSGSAEKPRVHLAKIQPLYFFTPYDPEALRETIVKATVEKGEYPLEQI